ncbi:MAG: hypothetical protein KatS3mg057_2714 [Herpetosiphonaceae bacterium]|nr:MAG: hypothetical protein KatS3mg057_2714 [Herpetosiphonaceae bacterium]
MNKVTRIIIGVLSTSLVILSMMAFAPHSHQAAAHTKATWGATWAFTPKSLAEARGRATNIVIAKVTDVRQADDIVVEAPGEPEGVDRIPTQRITFEVVRSLKGDSSPTLTLFHTGTDDKWIEGDPPYLVGETYLLFVEPKADEAGTYLVIAPEGRYRIVKGKVDPMVDHGFAGAMRGKDLAQVEREIGKAHAEK